SENSQELESQYLRNLVDRQVDGLILVPSNGTHTLPADILAVPTVVLDRDIGVPGADFVGADHEDGARRMVGHLVALGHRVIGCIHTEGDVVGHQRHAGYLEVVAPIFEELELDVAKYVWCGSFSFQSGMAGAEYLLRQDPPPTAIFASNDQQAIGAMRRFMDGGMSIPRDMSVAGYDDIPLASFTNPRLSTVSQPIGQIGAQAVQWLLERAELHEAPSRRTRRQATELKIRESCAPPRR
ncbi:MAG: substrate-binding domain-containing protein, partial [Actinomycetota bacterium]|nr:substrate-binding domain-containing protein [Actinomycetota bacterium]